MRIHYFFPGIECKLPLSNVKYFIKAYISGVVFAHNNLDVNAFIFFVLAGIDMFFHRRVFITEMFLYNMNRILSTVNVGL